jgi:Precorrin isomerase
MPPLFDAYLIVDWSAAAEPRVGADSIWIHVIERDATGAVSERQVNPPTRHAASAFLADVLSDLVARDRVTLVGCDFAFGYPAGFAGKICGDGADWRRLWREIDRRIVDGEDNANNRFEVAAALNRAASGEAFPFWSCPRGGAGDVIAAKKPRSYGDETLAEFRLVERAARGPKSVWQLYGAGSVGSQTLLGIAHLERLRRHPWLDGRVRVWPFETGLRLLDRPGADGWRVLLAEVYPSMLPVDTADDGGVKDARQVRTLARHLARLDGRGRLAEMFAGSGEVSGDERAAIEREEGWILGLANRPLDHTSPTLRHPRACPGDPAVSATTPVTASAATSWMAGTSPAMTAGAEGASMVQPQSPSRYTYIREPAAIYAQSFATIRAEADLSAVPPDLAALAIRVIHAAGDPGIVDDLVASDDAAAAGRAALAAGAPILVDTAMVAAGIIRRRLPAENAVICCLSEPGVAEMARAIGNTRSAAAVEFWRPHLAGAVVVIGNAPTALFHLLEMLDDGAPRPALILGFPVGFVGAAESKEALIVHDGGVPFVSLRGRRGGSAIAAAALNALTGEET